MRRHIAPFVAIAWFAGVTVLSVQATAQVAGAPPSGKVLYMRCAACHALTASAPRKVGPHLQGVIGRKAGSVAGFAYSPGLLASNIVWNDATMDKWLAKPRSVVPGTTMAFAGIADPAQRKALIVYLKKPTP